MGNLCRESDNVTSDGPPIVDNLNEHLHSDQLGASTERFTPTAETHTNTINEASQGSTFKVLLGQERRCHSYVSTQSKSESVKRCESDVSSKSKSELVDYAIDIDDIKAGLSRAQYIDALSFKRSLKSAESFRDFATVSEYVAKGAIGYVFLVNERETRKTHVMKMVRLTQASTCLKEWCVSKLLREAQIPNVVLTEEEIRVHVRGHGPSVVEDRLKHAGPISHYVCLFQEYVNGGTLEDFVKQGRLSIDLMFNVLADVASTLALMHETHVQHKDIKPDNVLLEMQGGILVAAKLADFGSAEIGDSSKGRADDIRRFGLLMFNLATGEGWSANNLLKENHAALVSRLSSAVGECRDGRILQLPMILQQVLNVDLSMQ